MATYKQLVAEKDRLEAQLAEVRAREVGEVIAQIQALMAEYELTIEDLTPRKRRGRPASTAKKAAPALPPKYRDPKTGKTWSGRGRAPAWLGKNPRRFLIAEDA
ncbi:H-NS histone family protein [Cupriavidus pauculus]|uniref:H-NS histone family protein n=1 Tax=Cupriavidus pauculus TaxID=82633 RepID=UPI0038575A3B